MKLKWPAYLGFLFLGSAHCGETLLQWAQVGKAPCFCWHSGHWINAGIPLFSKAYRSLDRWWPHFLDTRSWPLNSGQWTSLLSRLHFFQFIDFCSTFPLILFMSQLRVLLNLIRNLPWKTWNKSLKILEQFHTKIPFIQGQQGGAIS